MYMHVAFLRPMQHFVHNYCFYDCFSIFSTTLLQFLGTIGLVNNVSLNEMEISISFSIPANRFNVPPSALIKVLHSLVCK